MTLFVRFLLPLAAAGLALTLGPAAASLPAAHSAAPSGAACQLNQYQVRSQSGAGPFAPANDPFIKRPLIAHATFAYLNVGPSMPHFVLRLNTRHTWRAGTLRVSLNTGHSHSTPPARVILRAWPNYTWDLGAFPAGAVERVSIEMHMRAGAHYMTVVQTFGDVGRDGRPNPKTIVQGGGGGEGGSS